MRTVSVRSATSTTIVSPSTTCTTVASNLAATRPPDHQPHPALPSRATASVARAARERAMPATYQPAATTPTNEPRTSTTISGSGIRVPPSEIAHETGQLRGRFDAELGLQHRAVPVEALQRFHLVSLGQEHLDERTMRALPERL